MPLPSQQSEKLAFTRDKPNLPCASHDHVSASWIPKQTLMMRTLSPLFLVASEGAIQSALGLLSVSLVQRVFHCHEMMKVRSTAHRPQRT